VVLDPFCGTATTGLAALKNGRDFIGIDLNPKYIEIAESRARRHIPLLAEG
jgi:DNA modification methylase